MFEDDDDFDDLLYNPFRGSVSKPKTISKTATKKGKTMSTEELYEIHASEFPFGSGNKFATKLAENSSGKWVMEIKGTGEVIAIDPNKAIKVVPYTIGVKFSPKGTVYHYRAKAGEHSVGDFHVCSSVVSDEYIIVQVVEIDSKSDRATKNFSSLKKL